jgi:alpha-L-fucosidase
MKTPLRLTLVFLALALSVRAQTAAVPAPAPIGQSPVKPYDAAQQARMAWFTQARLGMFIHWGLYAIPAGQWPGRENQGRAEWIMLQENLTSAEYEPLAAQFNPVKFDARAWVAVAKAAGMKYIVITAKHHDGFSMYASKASAYNIVDATPFKRDPLKELAAACREAGMVFCVYYSLIGASSGAVPSGRVMVKLPRNRMSSDDAPIITVKPPGSTVHLPSRS